MRYLTCFLLVLLISCQSEIEKPRNLISEDSMIDIFYDLAIMDAMRSHNPLSLEIRGLQPDAYVYSKYKIDSLQFAQSNKYYASDIEKYKSMYVELNKRLKTKSEELDIILKDGKDPSELEMPAQVENSSSIGVGTIR